MRWWVGLFVIFLGMPQQFVHAHGLPPGAFDEDAGIHSPLPPMPRNFMPAMPRIPRPEIRPMQAPTVYVEAPPQLRPLTQDCPLETDIQLSVALSATVFILPDEHPFSGDMLHLPTGLTYAKTPIETLSTGVIHTMETGVVTGAHQMAGHQGIEASLLSLHAKVFASVLTSGQSGAVVQPRVITAAHTGLTASLRPSLSTTGKVQLEASVLLASTAMDALHTVALTSMSCLANGASAVMGIQVPNAMSTDGKLSMLNGVIVLTPLVVGVPGVVSQVPAKDPVKPKPRTHGWFW